MTEVNTWPLAHELLLELGVVLDDAVVDDGDVARTVEVGVGVDRLGRAVGGPARVADARTEARRSRCALHAQRRDRLGAFGGAARPPRLTRAHEGDARGVVAAVLQALESLEQRRQGVGGSYDPDDAAHGAQPTRGFFASKGEFTGEECQQPRTELVDEGAR